MCDRSPGRPPAGAGGTALTLAFAAVAFLLVGSGFATDDFVHLLHGLTRRLAATADQLQVTTRFQAGAEASRRGLV